MYKLKYQFIIFFVLFISVSLFPQTGELHGRITNLETGTPLVGANIWLKNTEIGAATNPEGKYSINNITPGVYDIVVNYIGFHQNQTENVKIVSGDKKNMDFVLAPDHNFQMDPRMEKIYLYNLDTETKNSLKEIKSYSEDVYFHLLQKIYFDNLASIKTAMQNSKGDDQIQLLTVQSNLYALKYKKATSTKEKEQLKSRLKSVLDKLFSRVQVKREEDVKNLRTKLDELNNSLKSLKNNRQEVINQKMKELLN